MYKVPSNYLTVVCPATSHMIQFCPFPSFTGNADKSRQFLFSLQRSGPSEALIEFVSSASRFRVQIYRENLLCLALAAGIVSPRASR